MKEEIKRKLDELFEQIEKMRKESDLFHLSDKSEFTKDVEELRGLHESVVKDYNEYQTSGKQDLEQIRNSLLRNSDAMEKKIKLVKKSYAERNK